jgi:RNA ligase (TIGR02306 family)
LPEKPEFEFMRQRKFRVKAIKLRGVYSYGLILPLSILPTDNYIEGDDVTKILGIEKYDSEAALEKSQTTRQKQTKVQKFLNQFALYRRFFTKKGRHNFPTWITKTDETRIQAMPQLFDDIVKNNVPLIGTEKLDGCSATFYLEKSKHLFFFTKYDFGYCSRNVNMTTHANKQTYFKKNFYAEVAHDYHIEYLLRNIIGNNDKVVIQGEIVGPSIQGNKYKFLTYKLFVFNFTFYKDGNKTSLNTTQIKEILCEYSIRPNLLVLKTVPILYQNYQIPPTMNELIELSKGDSLLYPTKREGIVWRNVEKGISFKVINPEFLIKHGE